MTSIRFTLVLVVLVLLWGCGGKEESIVARIGDNTITAEQFRERYEAYLSQTGQRDNIKLRKEILNNMINENLIMADLDARAFDDTPEHAERREQIRLQAMLDRYARQVSVDTIAPTEQEFREEFEAYNSKASVRYLYAPTEEEAWDLRNKLQEGSTFEELARTVFDDPGLANNGGYLKSVGWGETEPAFEQRAFSLPLGEISDPFPLRIGFGIMRVESRVRQPLASEYDYARVLPKLSRAIVQRRTLEAVGDVSQRLAEQVAPVFDSAGVTLVLKNWPSLSSAAPSEETGGDHFAGHPLVTFNGGTWNVGEFFRKVQRTSERQRGRVRNREDVEKVITGLIVRDELLRRAADENLDEDPDVQKQTDATYCQYRLTSWGEMVQDSAFATEWDESVLRKEYDARKEFHMLPPEVNVAEVLVRTRGEAEEIARRARSGDDFAALAKKNSIRLWAAKNGGELGYGTEATFGSLGQKFMEARAGAIIGPEFVDPYYGVFRILGKKKNRERSFEEAKPLITEELRIQKGSEAVREAVRKLRSAKVIGIDMEVLANIRIQPQDKGRAS